jgi:biotin carboxylase
LVEGPVHAEVRLHNDRFWVMEIAGRTIGGECARVLDTVLGMPLEAAVLRSAAGQRLELPAKRDAVGVLMIPITEAGILRRVEGVMDAERVRYIDSVQISIGSGNTLVPLPEGDSYLGFIFARGPTPDDVEKALRAAHACLRVIVAPAFDIQPA